MKVRKGKYIMYGLLFSCVSLRTAHEGVASNAGGFLVTQPDPQKPDASGNARHCRLQHACALNSIQNVPSHICDVRRPIKGNMI